jgi:DNA-binding winged helix-turn-helix (wHTH) protein
MRHHSLIPAGPESDWSRRVRYAFAEYQLDDQDTAPGAGSLMRHGAPVHVRPKVLALITLLLRRRQRVVDRGELISHLWPDVQVGESSLSTLLNEARVVLGDSGAEQRIIRTLAGGGYRFVGRVTLCGGPTRPIGPAERERRLDEALVGRADALLCAERSLRALGRGSSRHLLICGPLGIGRTRIIREIGEMARGRGFAVHTGHCVHSNDAPSLWPFTQILASLFEDGDQGAGKTGAEETGAGKSFARGDSGELLSLACDAPLRASGLKKRTSPTSPQVHFRRFEAIRRCLRSAGSIRPVLIVVEDLQQADTPTLLCLRHLVRTGRCGSVAIIATLRETAVTRNPEAVRHIAELMGEDLLQRVPLEPFTACETWELCMLAGHGDIGLDRLAALHRRTGGNPLFMRELLRTQRSGPGSFQSDVPLPRTSLLRARLDGLLLDSLPRPSLDLLRSASSLSGPMPLAILARLMGSTPPDTLPLLDPIERLGLLVPVPGGELEWEWAQPLVAESIHTSMGPREPR